MTLLATFMDQLSSVVWLMLGLALGAGGVLALRRTRRKPRRKLRERTRVADLIKDHFSPIAVADVSIAERRFPHRVRADLQRGIDAIFAERSTVSQFCGVYQEYSHESVSLADCLVVRRHNPTSVVPPVYEEVDIGDVAPLKCLKNGLWLLRDSDTPFVALLSQAHRHGLGVGVQIQVAFPTTPEGTRIADDIFRRLEAAVLQSTSYRGKILSLEREEHSYSGESAGIKVHFLRTVERGQVILPAGTIDLLDRNVLDFVRRRPDLARFGLPTKKGILFYGPPGTGKTHTIHYLAKALPGHTTLLITAEQVGLLSEYMTLARLLQPSIVVIEDVDLVARDREHLDTCEEVLLNKLLNEMDGLTEEAEILFILTTNRPESLERALASRPGRIDQAIEFPLPDAEGRAKLVELYAAGVDVPGDVVGAIVGRTENTSGAFIKELMRRSMQFHLERNGTGRLTAADIDSALDEMLFRGGSLNLKLLGAGVLPLNSSPPNK